MTSMPRRSIPPRFFLYVALVALVIFLLGSLAGTAYPAVLLAVTMFATGVWVASEPRWRALLRFLWGGEGARQWQDSHWTPFTSFVLLISSAVWAVFALLFFLFANVRLIDF